MQTAGDARLWCIRDVTRMYLLGALMRFMALRAEAANSQNCNVGLDLLLRLFSEFEQQTSLFLLQTCACPECSTRGRHKVVCR